MILCQGFTTSVACQLCREFLLDLCYEDHVEGQCSTPSNASEFRHVLRECSFMLAEKLLEDLLTIWPLECREQGLLQSGPNLEALPRTLREGCTHGLTKPPMRLQR